MLKALSTVQLYRVLLHDFYTKKIFSGVFPRDHLPRNVKYPSCMIINTDPSTKPGEHWLALYYDKDGVCEFFDSYGFSPSFYRLSGYLNRTSTKWTYNQRQFQPIISRSCGYYCFIFLLFKCRGIDLKNIDLTEKNLILVFNK